MTIELENYGIDFEYDPKYERIIGGDTLTAALMLFLRQNGVVVYKVNSPVIKFEGDLYEMRTRLLRIDTSISDNFQEVLDHVRENNSACVFLYHMRQNFQYGQTFESIDGNPPILVGDPSLSECRTIRLGFSHAQRRNTVDAYV